MALSSQLLGQFAQQPGKTGSFLGGIDRGLTRGIALSDAIQQRKQAKAEREAQQQARQRIQDISTNLSTSSPNSDYFKVAAAIAPVSTEAATSFITSGLKAKAEAQKKDFSFDTVTSADGIYTVVRDKGTGGITVVPIQHNGKTLEAITDEDISDFSRFLNELSPSERKKALKIKFGLEPKALAQSGGRMSITRPDGTVIDLNFEDALGSTSAKALDLEKSAKLRLENQEFMLESVIKTTDEILTAIEKDPSLVGAAGGVRRFGQTLLGIVEDVFGKFTDDEIAELADKTAFFIEEADIPDEQKESFLQSLRDPNLSRLRLFEAQLTVARARTLDTRSDRILANVLKTAEQGSKLVGLTSADDVKNRLSLIRSDAANLLSFTKGRLGKTNQPVKPIRTINVDGVEVQILDE